MKSGIRFLLFLAAFQMEVRVRASEVGRTFPEHCAGKAYPCSLQITAPKWSYEVNNIKLSAPAGTILTENVKGKDWTLIQGQIWVQNAPSIKVKTVSAEVEGSSGQYWILIEKNRTVIRNIGAKLTVTFKDQSRLEIPRGFEVWVGGVNSEARVEHGMVEPIHLKEHLKAWYELYPGDKKQFLSEVQDLKDQWADLVEESGDIYKKVAERKLASLDEEKRQQVEIQKKKDAERRRVRENFHRRVFEY